MCKFQDRSKIHERCGRSDRSIDGPQDAVYMDMAVGMGSARKEAVTVKPGPMSLLAVVKLSAVICDEVKNGAMRSRMR